jgi:hypothetical protein
MPLTLAEGCVIDGRAMLEQRGIVKIAYSNREADMQVLDIISSKLDIAQRVLRDLVSNYYSMDDTARIERANLVLDNVNSYLQIEQNILLPYIEGAEGNADILARLCEVQNRIDALLEKAVMVHVDEPDHQFYYSMEALQDLLRQAEQVDREVLFPWVRTYLVDADQPRMLDHLKEQTAHETPGSLEWQHAMFREKLK